MVVPISIFFSLRFFYLSICICSLFAVSSLSECPLKLSLINHYYFGISHCDIFIFGLDSSCIHKGCASQPTHIKTYKKNVICLYFPYHYHHFIVYINLSGSLAELFHSGHCIYFCKTFPPTARHLFALSLLEC